MFMFGQCEPKNPKQDAAQLVIFFLFSSRDVCTLFLAVQFHAARILTPINCILPLKMGRR
jgi:hypothetical protein